ncbi:MAG: YpdA family putative bacillithiol disulfide reductase [Trueperaceae bacterium]|nr:YpdA family putative bacillithiol disulfide reductase [Trueperaceae bacterium]
MPETVIDLVIVGAGPVGLEAAIRAKRAGLDYLVVEQGPIVGAINRYPTYMTFFTTSERLEIGDHPLVTATDKPTRKEALDYYRKVVANEQLNVRTYTRLDSLKSQPGAGFALTLAAQAPSGCTGSIRSRTVILATGYFDNPNQLGVPGEDLPHVSHVYTENHAYFGRPVVIIGGGSSAADAALDLYRGGAKVQMVHRGSDFKPSLKYWIRPNLENRIKDGSITAYLGAVVESISPGGVQVRRNGESLTLPADAVFALTGYYADPKLLNSAGATTDAVTLAPRIDPASFETDVPGLYVVGSAGCGRITSNVFIENGLPQARAAVEHVAVALESRARRASSPQGAHTFD